MSPKLAIRRAVAFAVAAAPCATVLSTDCGSDAVSPSDAAGKDDGEDAGCVQWQAPVSLGCMQNPWGYSGPVAIGTMTDPAACGLGEAGVSDALCKSICGNYGPYCIWQGDTIWCTTTTNVPLPDVACGRRPCGLRALDVPRSIGTYLANAAHLEAASVIAFDVLRDELAVHRAPSRLRRAATCASTDERRHARMMTRLARRRGAEPKPARCSRQAPRSVVAIAIENIVEGCVRETYGAAVALWQSEHASAGDIRVVMRQIARDEARHADLGWRVDRWTSEKLDASEQAAVRDAGVRAVEELMTTAAPSSFAELGLPAEHDTRAILQHLWTTLWRPRFMATGKGVTRVDGPQTALPME